jgi:anti-sigma factor RsiW
MELQVGSHLAEAELEEYSMGRLPEARMEAFEEHLLACDACQDRLLEMESFVNAIRSVSPKLRAAPRPV